MRIGLLLLWPFVNAYLCMEICYGIYAMNFQWNLYSDVPLFSGQRLSSEIIDQPLYVSLTTIHLRLQFVVDTVESILLGSVIPDHIYLFVSKRPYLLDKGINESSVREKLLKPLRMRNISYERFSVIYTENTGPHRKLLPLLARVWNEDCVIITIDDHEIYKRDTISSLLRYYIASSKNAVVSLRARRIAICYNLEPWQTAPYSHDRSWIGSRLCQWPVAPPAIREMLLLPTGTGGVLYRPRFFHPVIFDDYLLNLTATGDDLMFRLSCLAKGVPVVTACNSDTLDYKCPSQIPAHLAHEHECGESGSGRSGRRGLRRDHAVNKDASSEGGQDRSTPDPGASLSSMYNNGGGNNVMWSRSLKYLKLSGILDLDELLRSLVPRERSRCMVIASGSGGPGGTGNGSSGSRGHLRHHNLLTELGGAVKTSLQQLYDSSCALVAC